MSNPSTPPTDRFSIALAEVRASVVAETPRNRLARELQQLMLGVIEMLFGLLAQLDARAAARVAGDVVRGAGGPAPQAWTAISRGLRIAVARVRGAANSTRHSCAVGLERGDHAFAGLPHSVARLASSEVAAFSQFSKNR